jgi:hypothetical protein
MAMEGKVKRDLILSLSVRQNFANTTRSSSEKSLHTMPTANTRITGSRCAQRRSGAGRAAGSEQAASSGQRAAGSRDLWLIGNSRRSDRVIRTC